MFGRLDFHSSIGLEGPSKALARRLALALLIVPAVILSAAVRGPARPPAVEPGARPAFDLDTGRSLRREGRLEEAAAIYALAAIFGPANERDRARIERAETLLDLRRPAEALRALDGLATASGPLAAETLWLRALAERDRGNAGLALAALDAYAAAGGAHPVAGALRAELLATAGRQVEAVGEAQAALPALPEPTAQGLLLSLARAFDRAGDPRNALAWYGELASRTGDPSVRLRMAEIQRSLGDPAWAAGALDVVSGAPASAAAVQALNLLDASGVPVDGYARGLALYRNVDYTAAEAAFLSYRQAGGLRSAEAAFYLGAIAEDRGLMDDAMAWYTVTIEMDPSSGLADDALWWRASLRERSADLEGALRDLEQLAAAYPATEFGAEAGFRRGLLLYRDGQAAEAATAFASAPAADAEQRDRALYWQARALEADGRPGEARVIFEALAAAPEVDYYTLRAAGPIAGGSTAIPSEEPDWAGIEEWLQRETAEPVSSAFDGLVFDARWGQALELLAVGLEEEADAQLEALLGTAGSDPAALYQLARAFRRVGRVHLATRAAARLLAALPDGAWRKAPRDLVRLAYPWEYEGPIARLQRERGGDPLVMLALIRQESFFDPHAGSAAGALGLTQVIPSTGREVAAALGMANFDPAQLFRPYISVAIGGAYLATQLERFDGNLYYALAAYNGGPGMALEARDRAGGDIDLFVELLPFAETRVYVRRVMTHLAFYRYAYEGLERPALPGP